MMEEISGYSILTVSRPLLESYYSSLFDEESNVWEADPAEGIERRNSEKRIELISNVCFKKD